MSHATNALEIGLLLTWRSLAHGMGNTHVSSSSATGYSRDGEQERMMLLSRCHSSQTLAFMQATHSAVATQTNLEHAQHAKFTASERASKGGRTHTLGAAGCLSFASRRLLLHAFLS